MLRSYDLHQKEVVNIRTAEKLGYIEDVDIDLETGQIISLIVPKHKFCFFHRDDYIIPWHDIVIVGKDLVLVDFGEFLAENPTQ